jgi:hypothetical protein
MRIALIAPPWYSIPPSGYGGIEWVVALLADGLSDRDAIGDPWYEASHVRARTQERFSAETMVSGYEQVYDRAVGAELAAAS